MYGLCRCPHFQMSTLTGSIVYKLPCMVQEPKGQKASPDLILLKTSLWSARFSVFLRQWQAEIPRMIPTGLVVQLIMRTVLLVLSGIHYTDFTAPTQVA